MGTLNILRNDVFGLTVQGEGPYQGRPVIFMRVHGCHVQCPGCDTAYTWDGSERGIFEQPEEVAKQIMNLIPVNYRTSIGFVMSGGEPLMYANSQPIITLLDILSQTGMLSFISLETSGASPHSKQDVINFTAPFDSVCVCPKITPCLQGKLDESAFFEHTSNILLAYQRRPRNNYLKFVVRDQQDMDAVDSFMDRIEARFAPVYIMPYGITADEIITNMRGFSDWVITRGYFITPRLHTLIWNNERMR